MGVRMFREEFSDELYLEHLWFMMHHSDDPDRAALALTSYLDDSGTHEQSKTVVIGGPLIGKARFVEFNPRWRAILDDYHIEGALHMRDFQRPSGRYVGRYPEVKASMFARIADLINESKLYSVSVCVPQMDYKSLIPIDVYRKHMSPYGMAFFVVALTNCRMADRLKVNDSIAYVVDHGNHDEHLNRAHRLLQHWQRRVPDRLCVGAIAFDSDENVLALQAADVVVWMARKANDQEPLPSEFEPLRAVIDPQAKSGERSTPHFNIPLGTDAVASFAVNFNSWLESHGEQTIPDWPELAQLHLVRR